MKKQLSSEKKIAVLISNKGTGSNLQALIDKVKSGKIQGKIVVVVSDKADAYGLVRAKKNKIPTLLRPFTDFKNWQARERYGTGLGQELKEKYRVDLVVLAGWMIILPLSFLNYFPWAVINLHPGLIPDHRGGMLKLPDGSRSNSLAGKMADGAIEAALKLGVTYSGSTVHFVTEAVDWGPVILRAQEKIRANDTVEVYYGRLKKKEHLILSLTVKLFCQGKLKVVKDQVFIQDKRYKKDR